MNRTEKQKQKDKDKQKQFIQIIALQDQFQIRIGIDERITKLQQDFKSTLSGGNVQTRQPLFPSFNRRGKYRQVKYSYEKQSKTFIIHLNKEYYFNILNHKQYEIAMTARHIISILQEFSEQNKFFLKTVVEMKKSEKSLQILKIDLISMTVSKQCYFLSLENKKVLRKFFIRQSCFECRSSFSYRPREQEHLFNIFHEDFELDQSKQLIFSTVPNDQQYYQCPRLNFIDDLHTNQSLLRRFHYRFMNFYQAFSLYNHKVNFKTNKYIREFYRKCINNSYFYAMRMKKIGFVFSMKRLAKQKDLTDKQKIIKISLFLYFEEELQRNNDARTQSHQIFQNSYNIQTYFPDISDRILNENFLKRLKNLENQSQEKGSDEFQQVFLKNQTKKMIIHPKNQATYCRLLTQFSFFLDRIYFKLLEVKEKKKSIGNDQQTVIIQVGEDIILKLPVGEQFTLSQSKFSHHYIIELKSCVTKKIPEIIKKSIRDYYSYQNEIFEIKMNRRKRANLDEWDKEHQFFQKHPSQFKGLKIYLNSLLSAWNAREIYQQITDFVSSYLNIVVQKLKDKIMLKNLGKWSVLIGSMQALIQFLTQSLNSETTACKLYILQGFEDQKDGSQPGFITDLNQRDCVMSLTFSLFELTNSGWRATIPFCAYTFKVYKSVIWVLSIDDEKYFSFPLDCTKKKMETSLKQLLKKIHKDQIIIPPLFYE